jgi:hypothetical protein
LTSGDLDLGSLADPTLPAPAGGKIEPGGDPQTWS